MRASWYRMVLIAALLPLALACERQDERGPRELEARPAPPAGQGSPPAPAGPSSSDGTAAPQGASPGAGTDVAFTPPPQSCDDQVEVQRECWTEKFPPDISGKSDISCRFTMRCCGSVVQRWTRSYPQAAGPSGVVLYDTLQTTFQCRNEPTPLGLSDLDGDGEPNDRDANPWGSGSGAYPWE
ncbi:MAG TPA: hypothetical protein VF756_19525 [Thermoanaerobaculia bacterium]